jgi:hypothetical protein
LVAARCGEFGVAAAGETQKEIFKVVALRGELAEVDARRAGEAVDVGGTVRRQFDTDDSAGGAI